MQTHSTSEYVRGRPTPVSERLQDQPPLTIHRDKHNPGCHAHRELSGEYTLLAEAVMGFTAHLHTMVEDVKEIANVVAQSTAQIRMHNRGTAIAIDQHRQELAGQAGQIDAVISGINDITRQTSRLALKATVAANRTGVQSGGIAWAVSNMRSVAIRQWD